MKAQTGLADREAEILASALEQAGATDVETVQGLAVEAEVAASTAKTALESAKEGARRAKFLDDQLSVGSELVDDLARLMALLTNSQFIGELLTRRSQALLGVASQRLDEMTGSRYAFTADFEILDQLTGQPRDAKTLSGGEGFLASLALALGMVELAARAGGRLDALFLDEGFGALDTDNLNAAIDALEETAQEGRMVAVISHVKAVADRISDVMVVVDQAEGSRVFWLDDSERGGLSEQDVVAALAGLLD